MIMVTTIFGDRF